METSVDTLVYQLEDDDTNVRWNTLQKLRRIAAVETSHFPVRNTRRFLQCIRRRIVGETDTNVAIEALRLLADVMVSLGDNVDQILSAILPHLIPSLPKKRKAREQDGDSADESETLHEEMFQVIRKYVNVSNDLQAVADLLVNIGLGSVHGAVREVSLVVLMRLLDERFQKRTISTRGEHANTSIGRGDKALIVALVQAIIPSLEDINEKVVVAAEEAIAKLQAYWGSRFSTDVMKFLSTEDKQTLHEHQEPIADFLQAYISSVSPQPSPPQSSRPPSAASSSEMHEHLRDSKSSTSSRLSPSKVHPLNIAEQLHFGFLNADIVVTLTTNTTNSNTDWKKRAAAVEKLYAACKQVDASVLRGLTAEERACRMDELEGLFDILVRLTQDVDVHLVKRALQITQILFRKLAPPRQLATNETRNGDDFNTGEFNDQDASSSRRKDAAFYMTKMLTPMVETSANFAADDDEMEGFVYALLGQVFESGCVHINEIEQVLAATSLRHRRSQVREEALKIWMMLLLITEREGLLSANYVPNAFVVQTLGRLLGDTTAIVRDLAFELAAVLAMVCCCNIYALLETFIDDEYVAERVDWAALRARLRRKQVPELRSNGTLRLKPAETVRNADANRSYQTSSSVEQSLDGISELRMMASSNEPKSCENIYYENRSTEPTKLAKSKEIIGGSHSDRSYFDQQKTSLEGDASPRTTTSDEGEDINDKLAALKKKMDQLRQPRAKRVRRPNSQETIKAVRSERVHANMVHPIQQTLPRSKSSPEQHAFNPADDVEPQTQSKDKKFHLSPRDKRVYPGRVPLAVPASEAFVSSSQPTTQHSPQHLQSLQSDAHSYEDRPLKSKFIEQQNTLTTEEDIVPSRLSPDERPIRPKGATADTDQFDLTFLATTEDVDNNEVPSARTNKGERVMSLATRKRLEAKAKQDAQADNPSPTIRASPDRARPRESDTHKPWKKPIKSKSAAEEDEVDTKARPSGKQDPRYLEPHEITPLTNPKQDLSTVLTQLRSEDWEKSFDALNTVRRLAIHHASLIDLGKVHAIVTEILKQVPNLRSSVSKNALLALESMCSAFSRAMDSEVENIIPVLLKRCADSNAFVCESAAATLHAVVLKCSTSRVISAMNAHVSSKAVPIRREVARGVHALIVCHGGSILSSKELPLILQLVGRCIEDSHNEVRDIAKQSVLYLHYNQRMSRERIKRLLPAAAQAKVDSLLNGKTGYVSPMILGPTSVAEVVPDLLDLPAVKKQEASGASARPKKTVKQHSRRSSPPTSSNGTRSNFNADEMSRLEMKLDSSNWKDRFDALTETTEFICGNASAVMGSSQMLNLFDQLIKRLDDGNAKVNVLALECMDKIVPAVGTGIEQVLPNFVPVITKNLANARTSSLAQSVVQQLCLHADNRSLCQQFAIQARNTNARVVPILLDTLAQLAAQSLDDKSNYVLTRHVLPMAFDFLKEAKSGVKEANAKLLRQLRTTLGSAAMASAASKLGSSQQDKLAAILSK